MATAREVAARYYAMKVTDAEAHHLLGVLTESAPDAVSAALDELVLRRTREEG